MQSNSDITLKKNDEVHQKSIQEKSPQSQWLTSETARRYNTEVIRIAIIGNGVAAMLYPGDIAMQWLHTHHAHHHPQQTTDINHNHKNTRNGMFLALGRSYAASAQASMIKNATLAQRNEVDKILFMRETEEEEDFIQLQSKITSPIAQNMVVSGIIGSLDTSLSQYKVVMRTWHLHQVNMGLNGFKYEAPSPKSFMDYFKIFKVGYGLRLTRNSANVAGLMFTIPLKEKLSTEDFIPKDQCGLAATIISGLTVGILINVLDIIYKNKIIQTCPKTFKAPSALSVVNTLTYKEAGSALMQENALVPLDYPFAKTYGKAALRTLTRGSLVSIGYLTTAYYAVPIMENFANRVAPKINDRICSTSSSFFNQPKAISNEYLDDEPMSSIGYSFNT